MRPVFERLAEMEIPQDAFAASEAPAADMTLIHELDAVIAEGFVEQEQATSAEQAPTLAAGPVESDGFAMSSASMDFDHGYVEAYLGRTGGIAPLNHSCAKWRRPRASSG